MSNRSRVYLVLFRLDRRGSQHPRKIISDVVFESLLIRFVGMNMIKGVHKTPKRSTVSLILLGEDAKSLLPSVSQYGIAATLCHSVEEASAALQTWKYQAVLCDLKLRGATQFLQFVAANFPYIAVLVLTHPCDLRRGILATLNGASAYIQTPLEPDIVASVVERALDSKRLASALQHNSYSS